eukprot:scaffold2589_cov147-Amphora_coffeaeformis.AAC.2
MVPGDWEIALLSVSFFTIQYTILLAFCSLDRELATNESKNDKSWLSPRGLDQSNLSQEAGLRWRRRDESEDHGKGSGFVDSLSIGAKRERGWMDRRKQGERDLWRVCRRVGLERVLVPSVGTTSLAGTSLARRRI